jgi:hypothetical protein
LYWVDRLVFPVDAPANLPGSGVAEVRAAVEVLPGCCGREKAEIVVLEGSVEKSKRL